MNILIIHQYYLRPGQPGGSRFNEFARLWTKAGHHVRVIAGTVLHDSGKTPEEYKGKWIVREEDGGVEVWRCHVPSSYAKSYFGRMWGFLVFMLSSSMAAFRQRGVDVVIATSPPLTTAIPGWIAARGFGKRAKFIFEIRDLWPESAVTTGVLREKSLLTRLLYALERWACRSADCVNVLTPAFRDDLVRRKLVKADKVIFISNGADTDSFLPGSRDNEVRRELGWGNRFVALYAGSHGRANALHQLIDAAIILRDRPDILIVCVGDGTERAALIAKAKSLQLDNIVFHGPVPKERMPLFVNACDAGLAVLQNNPTFRTVYPNKVFDYLACERPTVLAIDGVARELVCDQAQGGVFVQPEDGTAIAEAIKKLASAPQECALMGKRGRTWVLAHATRDALAQRYLDAMEKLPRIKANEP